MSDAPPARPLELFISYAHENEPVKDRLLKHLATLQRQGLVSTWTDRAIPPGSRWRDEIESAIARADGAIFLVEEHFLASGFCMDVEVPAFLERQAAQGTLILFVLTQHCNWPAIDFIRATQLLPRDARPMRAFRPQALAYTHVVQEIGKALDRHRAAHPGPAPQPVVGTLEAQRSEQPADGLTQRLAKVLARLPGRTDRLFGRERELARLDAQLGTANGARRGVLLWVAPGGMGKSALTRWWLAHHPWPAGTRFVGHSFYSQGSRNQSTSARGFLLAALAGLGWEPTGGGAEASDYDLGERLAQTAARAPAEAPIVLLLDGLEPLQQASTDPELDGSVKDQGLLGLLETLARAPGAALCLASSRLPVPDPGIADGPGFIQFDLKALRPDGARALLESRGVAGSPAELDALAERCDRHPLALTLAAEFAHTFLDDSAAAFLGWDWETDQPTGPRDTGGRGFSRSTPQASAPGPAKAPCGSGLQPRPDAAETRDAESASEAQSRLKTAPTGNGAAPERAGAGRHAATIMGWFDSELARGDQTLDRELVACLGLFDRPAPWGALLALKSAAPPIPGLTEALHGADDRGIAESLARLCQWGLVDCDPAAPAPDLDAHPLVRERFGARLEAERPAAWRAAHRCLFEWFQTVPGEDSPDGLEGLEPLYRAVGHGCRAGLYDSARLIFRDRIQRGNQGYSQFQLGAVSANLSALAGFFPAGWSAPPATGDLSEPARSWLLGAVAHCLMSLGWLEGSLGAWQTGREQRRESGDWENFCISSDNLVDIQTTLGRWPEAERTAQEAIEASGRVPNRIEGQFRKLAALSCLGRALHGQGWLAESAAAFSESDSLQAMWSSSLPTLIGLDGFDYGQLRLEQSRDANDRRAVCERARASLAYQEQRGHLLSQALDYCQIGQSLAALGDPESRTQAGLALDRAVATMRRAGATFLMPILHLARANYHGDEHRPAQAQSDLDAALSIARRGNMQTYLADCALLEGHLHLDRLARPTPAPATAAPISDPAAADSPTGGSGLPDICVPAASDHPWHRVPASCRNDDQIDPSGLPSPDRAPTDPPPADPIPDAARAWAQANEIIRRTGYGRRETELHLLEARLRHHQCRPDQAREALACAQSRIEAIGQWGLWPRLTQVAAELAVQVPERPPQ